MPNYSRLRILWKRIWKKHGGKDASKLLFLLLLGKNYDNIIQDLVKKILGQGEKNNSNEKTFLDIEKIKQDFMNMMTSLGLDSSFLESIPTGTVSIQDLSDQLFAYFGERAINFINDPKVFELIEAMSNFGSSMIKQKSNYPEFATDLIKYVIGCKNKAISGNEIINTLNDLKQKADDPAAPKFNYIRARLQNNFVLAQVWLLLYAIGKFDKQTFTEVSNMVMENVKLQGPNSNGFNIASQLAKAKSLTKFIQFLRDTTIYRIEVPKREKFEFDLQDAYQSVLQWTTLDYDPKKDTNSDKIQKLKFKTMLTFPKINEVVERTIENSKAVEEINKR